jgi:UPF0755 protein
MNRVKLTLSLLTVIGIVLLCFTLWISNFLSTAIRPEQSQVIEIPPGSPFAGIAQKLEQAGVVSDARRFTLLARWRRATGQVHSGEYLFEAAATPEEILDRLTRGDIRRFQVTIPEGFNLREIAARLARVGIGKEDEILKLCFDAGFIEQLGVAADSLEGYLFPETYTYTATTRPRQLLQAMVEQLDAQLSPELLASAAGLGLDRHQLLTLASIIQKEAGNVMEMPLISAVFNNRLRRGIALQADPTVIYGIKDFNGNLTRRDLKMSTPYNTYTRRGLPPGPIASPGQFALYAAAHPAQSKALYFVARGDGSHQFSNTLKEHNRAVRRYQLQR